MENLGYNGEKLKKWIFKSIELISMTFLVLLRFLLIILRLSINFFYTSFSHLLLPMSFMAFLVYNVKTISIEIIVWTITVRLFIVIAIPRNFLLMVQAYNFYRRFRILCLVIFESVFFHTFPLLLIQSTGCAAC